MPNLKERVTDALLNLGDNFKAGWKEYSESPLRYFGKVALDYIDAAGAVAAGYAFCDTNNQTLGEYRVPIMFVGAAFALFGPTVSQVTEEGFLDLSYNPLSRASHRFTRNVALGLGSLVFFWYNRKEDVSNISQIVSKATGLILAIPAYFSERSRRKAPIQKNSVREFRKAEAARWKDFDKKTCEKQKRGFMIHF
ncbi:MAG: hypothetical protein NTX24_02105 [Candidatus Pacearchaeota archaeon]|nr:hypothetical protein [Candidatus Pacearchaeota archaeon]